jgi:hypothetical protein
MGHLGVARVDGTPTPKGRPMDKRLLACKYSAQTLQIVGVGCKAGVVCVCQVHAMHSLMQSPQVNRRWPWYLSY